MKLTDAVFYREYNGETFIYDTIGHYSHFVSAPIAEILDLFKEESSVEKVKRQLQERHRDVSREIISQNVDSTVDYFLKYHMLQTSQQSSSATQMGKKKISKIYHPGMYSVFGINRNYLSMS